MNFVVVGSWDISSLPAYETLLHYVVVQEWIVKDSTPYSVLRTEGNSMEMPHTSQSEFKDETEPGISIYHGENGWDVSVWAITIDDTEYRASEYSENITCSLPVALDSVVLGTFVRVP